MWEVTVQEGEEWEDKYENSLCGKLQNKKEKNEKKSMKTVGEVREQSMWEVTDQGGEGGEE